jgi:hypothetical membrane protein
VSRGPLGCGLIVAGLAVVALGVWLKRAHDLRTLMIVLHTLATLGLLIPGVMALAWRPNREDRPGPDGD